MDVKYSSNIKLKVKINNNSTNNNNTNNNNDNNIINENDSKEGKDTTKNTKVAKCNLVKPGMVFGELTVLYEDFEAEEKNKTKHFFNHKLFRCKCSCGEETVADVYMLLDGKKRSCGHLRYQNAPKKTKDLSGKIFGHLTVLYQDETKPVASGKHAYWICKCDLCGNEKSIRSSYLIDGKTDCGCQARIKNSKAKTIDLNNKTFGHLHVIGRDMVKGIKSGQHVHWVCSCDLCGRTESISSFMLLKYGKDRCKVCMGISNGEMKILELLEENNISFIHDKPYLDCRMPDSKSVLRFDFRITSNSECDYIIEFDGEQHFRHIPMYDSSLSYQGRVERDLFKTNWCKSHNIPIIRIPYTGLNKLSFNDLIPETSKYLVA